MKKSLSFSLVLLSALFLSACGVKDNNSSTTTPSLQQEETGSSSFSLRDLIAKNIPQKCTWTSTDSNGTKLTGNMVVYGGKFKQDIVIQETDSTITMHTISDGVWIYSWQENPLAQNSIPAMKMKIEDTQVEAEQLKESVKKAQENPSTFGSSVDYDQKTNYNCSPTIVSEADFQPPKNIEFTDYSQFLKDIKSNIPSIDPSSLE